MAFIEIKKLSKSYPLQTGSFFRGNKRRFIFKDISMDFRAGEKITLSGPSGCGKTTFGKCLVQLEKADSGQIIYQQSDIFSLSKSDLRKFKPKFQMIFQDAYNALNPRLTIGSAISEVLKVQKSVSKKEIRERSINLLSAVKLGSDLFNRKPYQLSGGQRRRAVIARALAAGPEFLIADEPGSGLDDAVKQDVFNLLDDLNRDLNLTILVISHDRSIIRQFSHKNYEMDQQNILIN